MARECTSEIKRTAIVVAPIAVLANERHDKYNINITIVVNCLLNTYRVKFPNVTFPSTDL